MELEPGFKLSEAGPIPEDWETKTIGQLAANVRNAIVGGPFGSDLTADDYRSHGVPVIRGSNLHGRYVQGPFVYVSPEKGKALEANLARPGDVVFTQRGTLGQVALVPYGEHEAYLVSQSQMKVSLDADLADGDFIVQVFSHPEFKRKVIASAIQTGVPHLNLAILRGYVVPRPTVEEQRAIARALCDIDAWIVDAEDEVSKLASVKAAAMEALLTPTTRLPGFEEDWSLEVLGDHFEFKNGISKAGHYFGYGSPIVNYMDVFNRPHLALAELKGRVFVTEQESQRFSVRRGDVFFTRTSETADEIGMASVAITDRENVVFSGFVLRGRPTTSAFDSIFLGYLLRTGPVRRQIEARATYTTRALTNGGMLSLTTIARPPLPEQRAIAAALSDIDVALASARAVVAKARGVKAAAMDALLSGRVRLPPFGPAAQRVPTVALETA